MSPVAKPNKNVLFNVEHSGSTPVFHNRVMQSPKSFKRVSSNASEAMQNYRKFQNRLEFAKKLGPLQNQDESIMSLADEENQGQDELTTRIGDNETV